MIIKSCDICYIAEKLRLKYEEGKVSQQAFGKIYYCMKNCRVHIDRIMGMDDFMKEEYDNAMYLFEGILKESKKWVI